MITAGINREEQILTYVTRVCIGLPKKWATATKVTLFIAE